MSRWFDRHREALTAELEEGEKLLAAQRVEIRGNVDDAIEGERVRTRGSPRRRHMAAVSAGFPLPGPFFVLGVSDQRLLIWRASPLLAAPIELAHALPVSDVARIVVLRRLGRPNLAVLLESGQLLVVRSLWGRGLRTLERAFERTR